MALQRLLLTAVLVAGAWYLARIAAAVLLLALSRFRPGCARAAQRCAPAALRPLIRRAIVTGLVGATLSGTGAWAATDPGCGAGDDLLLDRGQTCAAAADAGHPPSGGPDPEHGGILVDPPTDGPAPEMDRYLVRPGDSLWRIASSLRPGAAPAQVAAAWPLLWRANRDVIGDDPGLIQPGTELTVPMGVAR